MKPLSMRDRRMDVEVALREFSMYEHWMYLLHVMDLPMTLGGTELEFNRDTKNVEVRRHGRTSEGLPFRLCLLRVQYTDPSGHAFQLKMDFGGRAVGGVVGKWWTSSPYQNVEMLDALLVFDLFEWLDTSGVGKVQ